MGAFWLGYYCTLGVFAAVATVAFAAGVIGLIITALGRK